MRTHLLGRARTRWCKARQVIREMEQLSSPTHRVSLQQPFNAAWKVCIQEHHVGRHAGCNAQATFGAVRHVHHVPLTPQLRGGALGQRRMGAADHDQGNRTRRHVDSSRLRRLDRLNTPCGADGESAAGHAQQDCRSIGIAARSKPTDVMGGAVFTLQHGNSHREIRRRGPFGCADVHPLSISSQST